MESPNSSDSYIVLQKLYLIICLFTHKQLLQKSPPVSICCVLCSGVKHKTQAVDSRFTFKEHAYTKVFKCLIPLISTLSETDREWAPLRTRPFDINTDSSSASRSVLFWPTKQQKIKSGLLHGLLILCYIGVSLRLIMVPSRGQQPNRLV